MFEAREIRQDDPADEDDPDDDDMVEALHLRFAVGRWVSEIDPDSDDGQFVLEKLAPEEQEQYETTARRAQEAADKAEAERVEAERISKWRPLVATMDRCCKCLLGSRVSVVNLFLTRRLVHRDRSGGTCQGGCCCRCKRDRHCEGQGGGGTHPAGGG